MDQRDLRKNVLSPKECRLIYYTVRSRIFLSYTSLSGVIRLFRNKSVPIAPFVLDETETFTEEELEYKLHRLRVSQPACCLRVEAVERWNPGAVQAEEADRKWSLCQSRSGKTCLHTRQLWTRQKRLIVPDTATALPWLARDGKWRSTNLPDSAAGSLSVWPGRGFGDCQYAPQTHL